MTETNGRTGFQPYPSWDMHIYAPARHVWSACLYYRVEVPLRALSELGLAECFMDRGDSHFDKKAADQQAVLAMLTSDVNLLYSMGGRDGCHVVDTITGMNSGTLEGKLIYPPSVVYDIDDNMDWVHPYNATFAFYGTRGMDGHVLQPGEDVWSVIADPSKAQPGVPIVDGNKIRLWQDKVTTGEKGYTFDVARNHEYIQGLHDFARRCDGFTTPSAYLAKYMEETHGYPKAHVYPNSIIPGDWVWPKFAPRRKNIRVLWQGGGSHASDWFHLKPAMEFIAKKYPHVTFVFFGQSLEWITDAIPRKQLEVHEWVAYDAYRPTRAMLDCDINLCVLRDDEFSRSKSAIKFYEGSLGPTPAATLAPDMPPYAGEVVDGETGLLYDTGPNPGASAESFAANLQMLVENRELRTKLGKAAGKWVMENRHYQKTVLPLYDYYYDLRLRKMSEKPYDPDRDRLPIPPENPKTAPKKRRKVGKKK